ncbi:UPF0223 family protein [Halalkalibacillus halophilus]|uniref:UPF0223 family protein n=1 Tax=Halalkalibacillus halophilus TaxID=392827 RepID=UPI0004039826|nr:UPF0223 family protein [Halalkalibacillus halophilus]
MDYHYPIDPDWTTEQVLIVIEFFNKIEAAYEDKVSSSEVIQAYNQFKTVIPAKDEEKQMFKSFEKQTGYVPYKVVKEAKAEPDNSVFHM